jgi:hypothetical protein
MSTHVEGAMALVLVTVHATLSAGPAHLMLSAREGPAPAPPREPGATASATARSTASSTAGSPARPACKSTSRECLYHQASCRQTG